MRLSHRFTKRTVERTVALSTAAFCMAAGFAAASRDAVAQSEAAAERDPSTEGGRSRNPLVIADQGARPFGGTVIGEPDSSLHCDHGYVEWQIPLRPRRMPMLMVHASSTRTWESTWDNREGFRSIFLRRGFSVYMTDLPRTGRAGQGCAPTSYEPEIDNDQASFTTWRLGIWLPGEGDPTPNFYPNVQFPKNNPDALDGFFRIQYPEFNAPENEQIETDALAVLLGEMGPSIMLTHSSTGIRGWITATKSANAKAIISYEPGNYVFPEGEMPPTLSTTDGTPVSPGSEIPLAEFRKLTRIPIQIVWGDFIPSEPSPIVSLDRRRIRVIYSQQFVEAINRHGGDAEVLILPEIGVFGNTHFPMMDVNNVRIANLLSQYLHRKGLDRRARGQQAPRETTADAAGGSSH